ncbi:MAG: hypothetical protein LBR68_07610 [Lachnoclostridium sp.]|nr:hypothetical protein [Lachnoclostridium sp.]
MHTNKYKGLLRLSSYGLPMPEFIKIDNPEQLDSPFLLANVKYGWTIRTCKKNGENEMSLFYKNNASFQELKNILISRLSNHKDEFYVVYPSWDFYFSFNILKTKYIYYIEGKIGSQKSISSGQESPFFLYQYNTIRSSLDKPAREKLTASDKRYLLKAIKLLEAVGIYEDFYTEVAITTRGELFFYEYWQVNNLI